MAEETKTQVATDVAMADDETTRLETASAEPAVADSNSAEGGDSATVGEGAEDANPPSTKPESLTEEPAAGDLKADTAKDDDDTATASAADPVAANGTPASSKKAAANNRRKSGAGIPEHKKKTPSKKKGALELRLDVKPGQTWMVALRGYPPWPVIICDEEMLPEALLSKRPVSALRVDGTYREDFREGGKNAKDRRYPIMFLGTNEFAWQVNTDLQPFDIEVVKNEVENGNQQKKTKALWEAYQIAAEGRDLAYFKEVLENHEKALQVDAEEQEVVAAKKQEKKDKAKRKSTTNADDDMDMEDVDDEGAASAKKAKPSKKRKKGDESDGEPEKQSSKTPKTKLKLNNKAPTDSASKPKKESKAKKSKTKSESVETEPAKVEEPILTEAEQREKQEKTILYLRHRLQKGFLTRDQTPKEEEMANMNTYFKQLEEAENLGAEVIKQTKIHKVLRAILKLSSIPREDEFHFKKRSNDLLQAWTGALAAESANEAAAPAEPTTTNGVKHEEDKTEATSPADTTKTKPTEAEPSKAAAEEGDVAMADATEDGAAVAAVTDATAEVTINTATA